jgi:hypothetical protein
MIDVVTEINATRRAVVTDARTREPLFPARVADPV